MRKIVFCALLVLTLAALAACGTKVPCYACIGTGDCQFCDGEGELSEADMCEDCGGVNGFDGESQGSGECRYCSGSGVLEA